MKKISCVFATMVLLISNTSFAKEAKKAEKTESKKEASAEVHAEVKIGGGAAPMENIFKKIKEPLEAKGITLILSEQGPDIAFKELEAGNLDAASAGLSFNDWLDLMKKKGKGFEVKDSSVYKQRVIGRDRIRILMNKSLSSVKSLSKDQIKLIFTGKTKNWKDVGGPDRAITLVIGTQIPGTTKLWKERTMGNEEFAKGVAATNIPDIKLKVAANNGAIGIGSMGGQDVDLYGPEDIPEVSRPITVITKGSPSPTLEKVFDFIQKDGQKLIVR